MSTNIYDNYYIHDKINKVINISARSNCIYYAFIMQLLLYVLVIPKRTNYVLSTYKKLNERVRYKYLDM